MKHLIQLDQLYHDGGQLLSASQMSSEPVSLRIRLGAPGEPGRDVSRIVGPPLTSG
jgi:hypothetical protein